MSDDERELTEDEARAAITNAFGSMTRHYCPIHKHYILPCVLCAKEQPTEKQRRHKWVYPEVHVYVCKVCGMRKRNVMQDGWWKVVYRSPVDGKEFDSRSVPACVDGPFTPQFLAEYQDAIDANARKHPAPSTVLPEDWEPPF
jgi:hypothetical protein